MYTFNDLEKYALKILNNEKINAQTLPKVMVFLNGILYIFCDVDIISNQQINKWLQIQLYTKIVKLIL